MIEFVIIVLATALISQSIIGYFVIKLFIDKLVTNKPEPCNDRLDTRPIKDEVNQKVVVVPEIMPNLKKPPRPSGGFGSNVS